MITCTFEDGGTGKLRHITVNVLVINKEKTKILLARRSSKFSEPNKLSPLGGFMSRDENLEQTAKREGMEESGYEIHNLFLLRINDNPNRPKEDRQNVDMIFVGEAGEKTGEHDSEVTSVGWYDLNDLPEEKEFAFDHYGNIQLLIKYLKFPFRIPVAGVLDFNLS